MRVFESLAPLLQATTMLTLQPLDKGPTLFTPTNYTCVPGFFIQDSPDFNATEYDVLADSFGLLDKSEDRWQSFKTRIERLNAESDEHTVYKVLFMARHGEGWHNVAEKRYGTPEWNRYWSRLNTDGEITWGPDPHLTPRGVLQASAVNVAWKEQGEAGVPFPQTLYSSPLSRAASTLRITWEDILIKPQGVSPLFREHLRETIGLHTCDRRSEKSVLEDRFPSFRFETPFSEHDQLWSPEWQESSIQQALRTQQVLNQIFATDPSTYISITAHGGTIASLFRVVNHQLHDVPPGGFVPIVIKAVNYRSATSELLAGGQSRAGGPVPTAGVNREL